MILRNLPSGFRQQEAAPWIAMMALDGKTEVPREARIPEVEDPRTIVRVYSQRTTADKPLRHFLAKQFGRAPEEADQIEVTPRTTLEVHLF